MLTLAVREDGINNTFISNLPEDTPDEAIFKQCALEAKNGNDDQAHIKWRDNMLCKLPTPLRSDYDLHGNPFSMCYEQFITNAYTYTKSCSQVCKLNNTVERDAYMIFPEEDPAEVVTKMQSGNFTMLNCPQCLQPIKTSPIEICKGRNPSFFVADMQFNGANPRTVAETMPKEITISGIQFELKMITINQTARDHFMSLIRDSSTNKWIAYDGLFNRKKRTSTGRPLQFRLPFSSDWDEYYSQVNAVEYIRKQDY